MSNLATITVTKALRQDYDFTRALVTIGAIDWIVVGTNPNCEARAYGSLSAAGLIAYLPMMPVVRTMKRGARKKYDDSRPLIPRYLFVGLDRSAGQNSEMVRGCDGVENILTFAEDRTPHVVPKKQMRVIVEEAWRAQTDKNYVVPQRFDIGAPVEMTGGPFAGFPGVVSAYEEGRADVIVEVQVLGRATPVSVPVDKCKAVT